VTAPAAALSRRQLEVLRLMADGLTDAQVGAKLFLTENTVKTHMQKLLRKLEVHSRGEAVAAGYRLGLLDPGPGPCFTHCRDAGDYLAERRSTRQQMPDGALWSISYDDLTRILGGKP
jgi:DNA-binding CsgD family transcriptional regulator